MPSQNLREMTRRYNRGAGGIYIIDRTDAAGWEKRGAARENKNVQIVQKKMHKMKFTIDINHCGVYNGKKRNKTEEKRNIWFLFPQ